MTGLGLGLGLSPSFATHAAAAALTEPPNQENLILWLAANENLYSDTGGTLPVTTNQSRIGLWRDKTAGAWGFYTESSDGRPVLYTDFLGLPCVYFGLDPTNELDPTYLLGTILVAMMKIRGQSRLFLLLVPVQFMIRPG